MGGKTKLIVKRNRSRAVAPQCYVAGGAHERLVPFGILLSVVFVVGVPATMLHLLLKHREVIQLDQGKRAANRLALPVDRMTARVRVRFGKMYEDFKPRSYYWRACVMARKFGLISVFLLFSHNAPFQAATGLFVLFCAHVGHVEVHPCVLPPSAPALVRATAFALPTRSALPIAGTCLGPS